jgi:hypothetical protein
MIRPSNINTGAHTADFHCDDHDSYIIGLNVNTNTDYVDSNNCIEIVGAKLTSGVDTCDHSTYFPVTGGNQDAQDIATAKTS